MIQSFADEATRDIWERKNTKAARRIPQPIWPVVHRKLTMVDAAQRIDDLRAVPANRLEKLHTGQFCIRVNDRFRVTFRWEGQHAYDVKCEDYH